MIKVVFVIYKIKPWLKKDLSEDDQWDLKRKQGYPVVGLDVKVVDHEDKEVPPDGKSPGEILIRGPWITGSYHDAPGSEEQFTDDGYWKSGDAGTIDAEGDGKISDRVQDLIKRGGARISSVDLENQIMGKILDDGDEPEAAATEWLKANPDRLTKWLDGIETMDGEPALPAVKESLGISS